MVTGLDMISNNKPLQEHWVRRFVAALIDYAIVSMIFWVLFSFVWITPFGGWLFQWTIPSAFVFLYSGLMEGSSGATIGKSLLKLRVVSLKGELTTEKALIRNVSKVHGLLLLIDLLAGLATEGDPRQRYLDRIEDTTVVEEGALETHILHHQPPPPPEPPESPKQ